MTQATEITEPSVTAVPLTNPEREQCRIKASATAKKLGLRRMALTTYIRWAALNFPVSQEVMPSSETQTAQPA